MNEEKHEINVVKKVVITTQTNTENSDNRNETLKQQTLNVNNNINESSVTDVNNQIKVEKKNPIISFIIVLLTLAIIGVVGYFAVNFVMDTINKNNEVTPVNNIKKDRILQYVNDVDSFRKFEGSSYVILLSPQGYDLKNNSKLAFILNINSQGIVSQDNTIYEISNDEIVLGNGVIIKVEEDGINYNDNILTMKDSEKKYYSYKTVSESKLLLISSSSIYKFAAYIESNENNLNINVDSFVESEDFITLDKGDVFTKTDSGVSINGINLSLNN